MDGSRFISEQIRANMVQEERAADDAALQRSWLNGW